MPITLPALHHIGIVVPDSAAAAADFARRWGVTAGEPFDLNLSEALFRGVPTDVSARYRFIDSGASQIELIEPLSSSSPYTEFLEGRGEGVHHLAYFVARIDAYLGGLRDAGEPVDVLFDAVIPGQGRFVYLEGLANGPIVELVEMVAP
ncbi:catechol 2,3-dioxygenase-like lactoylglutathione lyase family enzyme [Saccharothrix coeruleofusca]|uniref:VOC family protein n=1 Tax=Saccharothrix coeruleofusca TaxID=33919 RepID=UPI001AE69549|nr:VOC family protein [Saccharothrix coeruleofusca]MBP2334894.1 catechol 2,3-dioxygenase-like lactoylglutathione lyase family enzyme [Saccharothrix coeruleofusca]